MSKPVDPGAPSRTPKAYAAAPWWVAELRQLIPEARIWIAAAVFAFAWHILDLIAGHVPPDRSLTQDTLFVSIASGMFGGSGVLAVIGFWFMSSKKDPLGPGGAA